MTVVKDRPVTVTAQTREELCHHVKEYLIETLAHLIKYNGLISIGVSGGSMPKLICDVLKSIDNFEWKRVRLFMVDERIVPVTDAESNYGQYLANLPAECHQYIVPVEIAESGPISEASKTALQYESTLRATLCPEQIGRLPRFDMLFLGMGPDGHTCSLFPGHRLLQKVDLIREVNDLLTWVVAVTDSPKPPSQRISLTLPVLNAAKNVAFIITGEDKASMTVLESDVQHVPASFVKPFSKKLRFFLDKGAASKL
ncbi:6-phosphogluconolactonase [Oesophagostomum dentatum]|uniref:6-phosphogluconolactonase n=1 Tax=Oesophagostomum dentatum TaxID=61180 RepID=A0A0B1TFE9_OESDE|nr:6-phosphogluconolactonase [Oesophagostomum dentatum]